MQNVGDYRTNNLVSSIYKLQGNNNEQKGRVRKQKILPEMYQIALKDPTWILIRTKWK